MIFEESFQIGNKTLSITTIKKLDKKNLESLKFLISVLNKELNHNISDSSAWKFNNGQPLIGIYVQPEFIQYFKFVFNIFKKYPDTFNPYSLNTFNENMYSFDEEENIIIKKSDFKFDTSYFRNIFIIEFLAEFLKELDFKEYLLNSDEFYTAQGKRGWLIKNGNLNYNLINESASFFEYSPSGFKSHKFGAIKNELETANAIIVAESLIKIKILTPQVNYVNTKTDLVKFCEENDIKIIFEKPQVS